MTDDRQGEKDINDIFDDILFTEEKQCLDGYKEGFMKGSTDGNPDGYHLGYHRGAEIGAELGYYKGVICAHLEREDSKYSEKVQSALHKINTQIDEFPTENSPEFDIIGSADDIRAAFKKLCALLKIDGVYPEVDILTF